MDCLFCRIISGSIPCKKVYEDDFVLAFHDIEPQAPVHVLVVPKSHIAGTDFVSAENKHVVAELFAAIPGIVRGLGLENGYRVVANSGKDAQQSVDHLHFHILGGRSLGWPPG